MKMTSQAQLRAYAAAFDMVPNTIFFVKGMDRVYHLANAGLSKICCMEAGRSVVGKATSDFFAPDYVEWCDELDQEVISGRSYKNRLDCLYDARGTQHWTRYSRKPITLAGGEQYILSVSQYLDVTAKSEKIYKRLQALTDEIQSNLGKRWTLDVMTAMTGSSKSQVERDFAEIFKQSPMDYVNSSKLDLAKDLIEKGDDFVDIAANLGFSEQSAFSRFFKRTNGITPTAYRDSIVL